MDFFKNLNVFAPVGQDVVGQEGSVGQDVAGAGGHGAEGSGAGSGFFLLKNVRYHSGNVY